MKTIAYQYLFNYFGGDTYKDKVICGAAITVAIRVYKEGKEVKFENEKELSTNNKYLSSVFDVSFDRNKLFAINRNLSVDNLFRLVFGFDEIKAEIINYNLDYIEGKVKDIYPKLELQLTEFDNLPVSTPLEVTEAEFRDFMLKHIDDFDISDNKHAQVPSVVFID